MNSIVRLAQAVNRVSPLHPHGCLEQIQAMLEEVQKEQPDLIAFPAQALCPPCSGSLAANAAVLEAAKTALDELCRMTKEEPAVLLAGTVLPGAAGVRPVTAVLHRGRIRGYVGCAAGEEILPPETVFELGGLAFCVVPCALEDAFEALLAVRHTRAHLYLAVCHSPVQAGQIDTLRREMAVLSRRMKGAVALLNGGAGDTSSPYLYQGFYGLWQEGEERLFARVGREGGFGIADLDADLVAPGRSGVLPAPAQIHLGETRTKWNYRRIVRREPYLSRWKSEKRYLREVFSFQVKSLADRLENTGIEKVVVGVSGGLDSTLALLVSAAAMDQLSLPRTNIIGVTMPGLGTTDRTYYNALSLLEGLGADARDISIRQAVMVHFEDIGLNPAKKDVAYENAQARERAQILLDLGNMHGALVVGTGDLSEEALGWCTFAGDHIANYNVNVCLTKNMIRRLVGLIHEEQLVAGTGEVLSDILDTPVSPELLPPDESGQMTQRTEEILGSYDLHDFFLFYLLRYGLGPAKLYYYACTEFGDQMTPAEIKERLKLFFRRFFSGQFKRSCAPDSAAITDVNLLGEGFFLPSDASPREFLREIDQLKFELGGTEQ